MLLRLRKRRIRNPQWMFNQTAWVVKIRGRDVHWVAYSVCQPKTLRIDECQLSTTASSRNLLASARSHRIRSTYQVVGDSRFPSFLKFAHELRKRLSETYMDRRISGADWNWLRSQGLLLSRTTGGYATSELSHRPRGLRVTANGLVYVLLGEMYTMSASVDVDTRTMHRHNVAVDAFSGYKLIAHKCFPFGSE